MSTFRKLIITIATIITAGWAASASAAVQPVLLDRIVAIVNDEVITKVEFDRRVAQIRAQLDRRQAAQPAADVLEPQVLEHLIVERIQTQMAVERGIRISDAQLERVVERVAHENGLDLPGLRARVADEGMSFDAFRAQLRDEYLRTRLREREVDSKVTVSEADIDSWLAQQSEQLAARPAPVEYEVGQILLRVAEDAPAAEVARQRERALEVATRLRAGEDINTLAAEYTGALADASASLGWRDAARLPQLFLDAIVSLEPGGVAEPVRSPNGFHVLELLGKRAAEDANSAPASVPIEQTHVRHILVQPDALLPEAEAVRRLADIRERVLAGAASFDEMARQYSSDGSAGRGGDLGWVYPGDTVPEFERAMNALGPGEVSEIVRTPFGLHLIQVLGRRTDQASPERLRQAARQAVREQRIEEAYENWVEELRDSAYVVIRRD